MDFDYTCLLYWDLHSDPYKEKVTLQPVSNRSRVIPNLFQWHASEHVKRCVASILEEKNKKGKSLFFIACCNILAIGILYPLQWF